MKGLIIVGTVLVQEQNLGQLLTRWRSAAPSRAPAWTGSAETNRLPDAIAASTAREDIHETS
jgi:simple sugar transport system permease protein